MSESAPSLRIPFGFAKQHELMLTQGGEVFHTNATPWLALAELHRHTQGELAHIVVEAAEFRERLRAQYESSAPDSGSIAAGLDSADLNALVESVNPSSDLLDDDENAPVVRLINALLAGAIRQNASDVHLEPFETRVSVRFRVDGALHESLEVASALAPLLASRIKVMAKLDIAEKRLPQDGRIALQLGGRSVDVRVSTLPGNNGERVVMRLLDKSAERLRLGALGMDEALREAWRERLALPHGVLLVTGPTGSGKTTTLYASLLHIRDGRRNLLTIEDPIEYDLDGIGQTQVSARTGLTFAKGLRAMLRQDPDVVMVGEIRDRETAEIAVQASLTGHLVLSTLHTISSAGAVTRLIDMGVERFLLASSLAGVLAQRLVRVLCTECKVLGEAEPAVLEQLGWPGGSGELPRVYRAAGCNACRHGYAGRTAIYEFLPVTEPVAKLIYEGASEAELSEHAVGAERSLAADGLRLVLAGATSLEELLRVALGRTQS